MVRDLCAPRVMSALISLIVSMLILVTAERVAAVHAGFELDGDTGDSPAGAPEDWHKVYKSALNAGPAGTSSALRNVFLPDSANPDPTTFTGGSKDGQPISGW